MEIGEGSTGSFSTFEVLLEALSGPQNVEKINNKYQISPLRTRIISIVSKLDKLPDKALDAVLASQAGWLET